MHRNCNHATDPYVVGQEDAIAGRHLDINKFENATYQEMYESGFCQEYEDLLDITLPDHITKSS